MGYLVPDLHQVSFSRAPRVLEASRDLHDYVNPAKEAYLTTCPLVLNHSITSVFCSRPTTQES